jgi:hypothetical protein
MMVAFPGKTTDYMYSSFAEREAPVQAGTIELEGMHPPRTAGMQAAGVDTLPEDHDPRLFKKDQESSTWTQTRKRH